MARERWVRDTTFFLSGQTVSLLGSSLVQYAILWYLTLETQSGVVLTLATAFGFLPQAVMSVFGGVWADRHNRKLLLIAADAVIAATTLVLAVMLWNGFDGLWLIYATLAIRSLGAGVQTPAVGALLPQIVPTDKLMRVNGINMSIQSAMTLLAPALAAALFALMGLQAVLSSTSSPPSSASAWSPSSRWRASCGRMPPRPTWPTCAPACPTRGTTPWSCGSSSSSRSSSSSWRRRAT